MPLAQEYVESNANMNLKYWADIMLSDTQGAHKRTDIIAEAATAASVQGIQASGGLATTVASLGSVVADLQQFVKAAGNTPPVTP
jgi:hypothetical protein